MLAIHSKMNILRRDIFWIAALVFAVTFAVFAPSLRYEFLGFDDEAYVSQNPMVLGGISSEALSWALTARAVGHWAPLLWVSYMLDSALWGTSPAGFHFTNTLLHAINAALFFIILVRWTGRKWMPLWGALIWALHPLRVESVAWIAERKDVLSGFFFLLCLLVYTRKPFSEAGSRRRIWAVTALLFLGLLVKPVLITVPIVLLLLDIWPLRRLGNSWSEAKKWVLRLVVEKWPIWLTSLVLGSVIWQSNVAAGIPHTNLPAIGFRLMMVPGNYLRYLYTTLWPHNLSPLYPTPLLSAWLTATGLIVLLAITLAVIASHRKHTPLATGWLWFLVMLVPSIGIIWMGTTEGRGDRFSYLPAMGLSVIALVWNPTRRLVKQATLAVAALLLLGASVATLKQLPVWTNDGTLFGRILAFDDDNVQAKLNYGIWLQRQGDEDNAQNYFRRTFTQSDSGRSLITRAAYDWALNGHANEARAMAAPNLKDPRATAMLHGAHGMAALALGDATGAIPSFERAIALNPQETEFRVELARANFQIGNAAAARALIKQIKNWPGNEVNEPVDLLAFYFNRWRVGSKAYAWSFFAWLGAEQPDNVGLLNNFAWLAATDRAAPQQALNDSLQFARRAAELTHEQNATTLDTLAANQARADDFEGAVATARKALNLAEQSGDNNRAAKIQSRLRRYTKKMPWFE